MFTLQSSLALLRGREGGDSMGEAAKLVILAVEDEEFLRLYASDLLSG